MKFRLQEAFAVWKRHHPPETLPKITDRCSRCRCEYVHHWETYRDGCGGIDILEAGCFDQCMCKGFVSEEWVNQKLDEAIQILRGQHKATNQAAAGGLSLVEPGQRGALSVVDRGQLTLKK